MTPFQQEYEQRKAKRLARSIGHLNELGFSKSTMERTRKVQGTDITHSKKRRIGENAQNPFATLDRGIVECEDSSDIEWDDSDVEAPSESETKCLHQSDVEKQILTQVSHMDTKNLQDIIKKRAREIRKLSPMRSFSEIEKVQIMTVLLECTRLNELALNMNIVQLFSSRLEGKLPNKDALSQHIWFSKNFNLTREPLTTAFSQDDLLDVWSTSSGSEIGFNVVLSSILRFWGTPTRLCFILSKGTFRLERVFLQIFQDKVGWEELTPLTELNYSKTSICLGVSEYNFPVEIDIGTIRSQVKTSFLPLEAEEDLDWLSGVFLAEKRQESLQKFLLASKDQNICISQSTKKNYLSLIEKSLSMKVFLSADKSKRRIKLTPRVRLLSSLKWNEYIDLEAVQNELKTIEVNHEYTSPLVVGVMAKDVAINVDYIEKIYSRKKLKRLGRQVKMDEVQFPRKTKHLQLSPKNTIIEIDLYALSQTTRLPMLQCEHGKIKTNVYGNVEIYHGSMIPHELEHISKHFWGESSLFPSCSIIFRDLPSICAKLTIEYAKVVVGFKKQDSSEYLRHSNKFRPTYDGIVIFKNAMDILIDACGQLHKHNEQERKKIALKAIVKRWEKLTKYILLKHSVSKQQHKQPIPEQLSALSTVEKALYKELQQCKHKFKVLSGGSINGGISKQRCIYCSKLRQIELLSLR